MKLCTVTSQYDIYDIKYIITYNITWQCKTDIIYYTHKAQMSMEKIEEIIHNAQKLCSRLEKDEWKCDLTAKMI